MPDLTASLTAEEGEARDAARYARSKNGKTVHRADCHLAAAGVPWRYADGMDHDALLEAIAPNPWLRPCGVCKPLAPR